MTRVVGRLCERAHDEMGLSRIVAYVFPRNPASARVMEKCGFSLEGALRKYALKDGRFLDAKLYALVR
jgi:RimJ/RimL family protein N-acetyltransferase